MLILRFLFAIASACVFLGFSSVKEVQASKDNSLAYAHYMMGVLFGHLNKPEEALAEFKEASRYDSTSDSINLRIALEYIKLGKNIKAIDELNRALELNPDNVGARSLLAFLYSAEGQYELAEIQYELLLKQVTVSNPENLAIHNYLGQLYFQQRKFDKALEQFKFILGIEPKNVEAKLFTGLIYEDIGSRKEAIEEFKEILEIEPENADGLNALGYVYAEAGENLDEAEELILKALAQGPNNAAYIDSLGWVYFKKGKLEEALEKLKDASSLLEDPVIYDHLADVYFALGQKDKAKEVWQKALSFKPKDEKVKERIEVKIKALDEN